MTTQVGTGTGFNWIRMLVLLGCGLVGLVALWQRGMEWRQYRKEVRRPGLEWKSVPGQTEIAFSRFPVAELRDGALNVFNLGRSTEMIGKDTPARTRKATGAYRVVGVVKRGRYILVVSLEPENRLAWVRVGEEISPGVVVKGISPTIATVQLKDGSLREHRVFELIGFPTAEVEKRSRQ